MWGWDYHQDQLRLLHDMLLVGGCREIAGALHWGARGEYRTSEILSAFRSFHMGGAATRDGSLYVET